MTNCSIKESKNIPVIELISNHDKYLSKDDEYYIICQSGARSSNVCTALTNYGYKVINIIGGMTLYGISHELER